MCTSRRQQGMTLIELIVFIVIVSTALAGVLSVLNITARSSSDPMVRKQMLAIAEALLEEVQSQPFTWCDPTDINAATAVNTGGCASIPEALGVAGLEAGQTRTSAVTPFNNVNDYNGCAPGVAACNLASPIPSISGTFSSPAGYSATIGVTAASLNGVGGASSASATLRIAVTVTNGANSIVLEGYRMRHSPNFLP